LQLEGEIEQAFATRKLSIDDQLASVGICEAFKELIVTLSSVRMSPQADPVPLVILAFDEACTLAVKPWNEPWSYFSELCRALRTLNDQPLFSLFLTTTGNALVPLSGKVQSKALSTTRPFAEVGFDHFAFKDQFDLRAVADDEHISHFGRPLCVF
jgi:hypothetical protein